MFIYFVFIYFSTSLKLDTLFPSTKTHQNTSKETVFTDTMPFSECKSSNGISKQMSLKINHKKCKNQNLMGSVSTEVILIQAFK